MIKNSNKLFVLILFFLIVSACSSNDSSGPELIEISSDVEGEEENDNDADSENEDENEDEENKNDENKNDNEFDVENYSDEDEYQDAEYDDFSD